MKKDNEKILKTSNKIFKAGAVVALASSIFFTTQISNNFDSMDEIKQQQNDILQTYSSTQEFEEFRQHMYLKSLFEDIETSSKGDSDSKKSNSNDILIEYFKKRASNEDLETYTKLDNKLKDIRSNALTGTLLSYNALLGLATATELTGYLLEKKKRKAQSGSSFSQIEEFLDENSTIQDNNLDKPNHTISNSFDFSDNNDIIM